MKNKKVLSFLILYLVGAWCPPLFGGQDAGGPVVKKSFNTIDDSRGLARVRNLADQDAIGKAFEADKGGLVTGKGNTVDENAAARLAVKAMASVLRNNRIRLDIKDIHTDSRGNHHVIMQEYVGGVVIDGALASLHFDKDWRLLDATGLINNGTGIASVAPALDGKTAGSNAAGYVADKSELVNEPRLMVRGNTLVYHCMVREPVRRDVYNVVVDARSGSVLSMTPAAVHYDPPGYPAGSLTNQTGALLPREGGTTVGFTGWQSSTTNLYYLFNNAEHWQAADAQIATPDLFSLNSPNWGRTIPRAISLAYNIGLTQRFCRDSLRRNSFDGNGKMAIYKFVNNLDNNAQYRPDYDEFWFGRGDGVHYEEMTDLETVAHEFGHGITSPSSSGHDSRSSTG
jgi:Zn-dependent metalloprotease